MVHIQKLIGINCKNIRLSKKLTLDEAATVTGVSRSMLAQIEKGNVNPTISLIWKIAEGYKISFSAITDPHDEQSKVIKANEIEPLIEGDGLYLNYPIFPIDNNRPFETYKIEIKKGGFLEAKAHILGCEEYITVFDGTIEITANSEIFRLSKGDSIKFKADVPHSYKNIGENTAILSMILFYSNKS